MLRLSKKMLFAIEQLDAIGTPDLDTDPVAVVPEGMTAREFTGVVARGQLKAVVPGAFDLTDAEMCDSFYYTLFPNMHPWGAYNRIVYRFRPNGNDHRSAIMEYIMLAPFQGERPPAAKVRWLEEDEPWSHALGYLGKVFDQDSFNMPKV